MFPCLPMQDIWHHIHSLMPLRDAACAACLSHAFLHSWRCYHNLTFNKDALRPEACTYSGDFADAVDCIMRNHSGIDVKILELEPFCIAYRNLNSWLQVAVKPFCSKSHHSRLLWKTKTIAWRRLAVEEIKHVTFRCYLLCSYLSAIHYAKS